MPLFKSKSSSSEAVPKNPYTMRVECLNGSDVDVALSSKSNGSEFVTIACTKLQIKQVEIFGLHCYLNGVVDEDQLRFVDLDKPLTRELEKYGPGSSTVFLRTLHYPLPELFVVTDVATKNYIFAQLKRDIKEGRIVCDADQAVTLANYCRQAEYGDHRYKSVDYLKSLLVFPKNLTQTGQLEKLTEVVMNQQNRLQGLSRAEAEDYFISKCQTLDGYGEDRFTSRRENGVLSNLGISGLGFKIHNSTTTKFYRWSDISTLSSNSKTLLIECHDASKSFSVTLQDSETCKYIWKLCIKQSTFFKNHFKSIEAEVGAKESKNAKDDSVVKSGTLSASSSFDLVPRYFEEFEDPIKEPKPSEWLSQRTSSTYLGIPNSSAAAPVDCKEYPDIPPPTFEEYLQQSGYKLEPVLSSGATPKPKKLSKSHSSSSSSSSD